MLWLDQQSYIDLELLPFSQSRNTHSKSSTKLGYILSSFKFYMMRVGPPLNIFWRRPCIKSTVASITNLRVVLNDIALKTPKTTLTAFVFHKCHC